MKTCTIDGCERKHNARGWCTTHYERWRAHGDPLAGRETRTCYVDAEAAFGARTEPLCWTGCVVWTGHLRDGYGTITVNGRPMRAHRYAWERERGPIPDGMVIDHTCWERSCVNVDHLRLATVAQNVQNRSGARKGRVHDLPRGVNRNGRGYSARVHHNGTLHHIGTFKTPEEASRAAQIKRAILFGEFAGGA